MNMYKGIVERGKHRGHRLGYPTINIRSDGDASGIFAASVTVDDISYPAAAFADPSRKLLEAHILDFDEDVYGKEVSIELHKKIRESAQFTNDESLKAAIAEDVEAVRQYFDL